jgi:hypothetical protein
VKSTTCVKGIVGLRHFVRDLFIFFRRVEEILVGGPAVSIETLLVPVSCDLHRYRRRYSLPHYIACR